MKGTDLEDLSTSDSNASEKFVGTSSRPPSLRSTVVSCETSLISVGGVIDCKPQDVIYRFVREKDGNQLQWIKVGNIDIGKYRHAVVPLKSHTLFVAGGYVWEKSDANIRKSASVEGLPL